MKRILSALTILIALTVLPLYSASVQEDPSPTSDSDIVGSIVKVYSRCYPYSYESPWLLAAEESGTGSGCIISGNRILTSAHVVANAKFIQVKRAGGRDKAQAEVEVIGHQCDLAVLRVKDPLFFEGAVPLAPGPLVSVRDRVTVYGFPEGGEELGTTEGIVSRVELQRYAHSRIRLLCGQMDAAINPGSSGGPVIMDGRIVGIAFQALGGENISYMVPSPVIEHFLKDIEDGDFDGLPGLGLVVQSLENPDLRLFALEETTALTPEQRERMFIIFSMLISLFERAYLLLYEEKMTEKQLRRWRSWEDYMGEWCNRIDFRSSLPVLLRGEDPEFAAYIQKLAVSSLLQPQ